MTSMMADLCHWAFTYAKTAFCSRVPSFVRCYPDLPPEKELEERKGYYPSLLEQTIIDTFLNPTNEQVYLTAHAPVAGTKWVAFSGQPMGIPVVASNNGGYIAGDSQSYRSAASMTLPKPFAADVPITITSLFARPYLPVPAMEMSYNMVLMNSVTLNGLMFQVTSSPLLNPPCKISLFELVNGQTPKLLGEYFVPNAIPANDVLAQAVCTWNADGTCSLVLSWTDGSAPRYSSSCAGKTTQIPGTMPIDTFMLQLETDNPIHSLIVESVHVV